MLQYETETGGWLLTKSRVSGGSETADVEIVRHKIVGSVVPGHDMIFRHVICRNVSMSSYKMMKKQMIYKNALDIMLRIEKFSHQR